MEKKLSSGSQARVSPMPSNSSWPSSHSSEIEESDELFFQLPDSPPIFFDGDDLYRQLSLPQAPNDPVIASGSSRSCSMLEQDDNGDRRKRVSFVTKSDRDILEDGYGWRKYGKKRVKGTPHPRHYYRCSIEGCGVKKRVERHREDSSYVITSYEGLHNHHPQFSDRSL